MYKGNLVALKRSDIIKLIQGKLGLQSSKSYNLFNQAIAEGIMATRDNRHYYLAVTEGNK